MPPDIFFEVDEGGRRGHSKNYLKEDVDWMLESLFMVTGLLTSGIDYCLSDSCVNCSTLNSCKTNISLELDRKPELNVLVIESRQYMARACAYLCHQCRHGSGGFSEFGEQNRTELYYHKQNTYGRLPE